MVAPETVDYLEYLGVLRGIEHARAYGERDRSKPGRLKVVI